MRSPNLPIVLVLMALALAPGRTTPGAESHSLTIYVEHDRLYRVTGAAMAEAGLPIEQIDAARINLYNNGRPVPIAIEGLTSKGALGSASAIIFWGEFPRGKETRTDLFATENAYILRTESPDPPARYHSGNPIQQPARERFVEGWSKTLHLEHDSLLVYRQHYSGMPTDRTMWASFKAPPRHGSSLDLDSIPDLAPGARPTRIRLLLWGSSDLPDTLDHDWDVLLNGGTLGRARWDGTTHLLFESDSIGALFRPRGANTLTVRNNRPGDAIDAMLLDWIEIDYQAALLPEKDFLEFELKGDAGQPLNVRLAGGFSAPTVRVFDVSAGIEFPATSRRDRATHGYGAEFGYQGRGAKSRLVAVGPGGFAAPTRMALGHPSDLRGIKAAPEYLVVAHHAFMDGARELVERRRSQGLSALLVDIDDVYAEYSYGRFSPQALKSFIDDLLAKPGPDGKRLRYVLLVGDATSDFKHAMKNSENFVPTLFETEEGDLPDYWAMYARDDSFVYGTDGKRVPKAAIGRLPCRSADELRHFLDKLAEFESTPAKQDSTWARRGIFIGAEGFTEMCKWVATEDPFRDWRVDTIYAKPGDVGGNAKLQERIIESLDRGAGVVYFVGHGAYLRWRTGPFDPRNQTDLFTKEHLAKLTNRGRYPVVITATCYSAMFDNPAPLIGAESGIGVYMVEAEEKGAIACIGHVGKTSAGAGQAFSQRLCQSLFTGSAPRLGDAFLAAKQQFYSGDWAGMALIGDPATYFGSRYAAKGQAAPGRLGP